MSSDPQGPARVEKGTPGALKGDWWVTIDGEIVWGPHSADFMAQEEADRINAAISRTHVTR